MARKLKADRWKMELSDSEDSDEETPVRPYICEEESAGSPTDEREKLIRRRNATEDEEIRESTSDQPSHSTASSTSESAKKDYIRIKDVRIEELRKWMESNAPREEIRERNKDNIMEWVQRETPRKKKLTRGEFYGTLLIKVAKSFMPVNEMNCLITMLRAVGAEPSFEDEQKCTALHYITQKTEKKYTRIANRILEWLVEMRCPINLRDSEGRTPLHLAYLSRSDHMTALLIQYSDKNEIREIFGEFGPSDMSFHKMIKTYKMKRSVLAVLDCLWDVPESGNKATAHFAPLNCDSEGSLPTDSSFKTEDMTCFHLLAREEDEEYINHQVITEIINSKWKHARIHYVVNLVCNVLVAVCLLVAAVLALVADDVSDYKTPISKLRLTCEVVVCVGKASTAFFEIVQCHSYGRKYWQDKWNYVGILSVVLTALILPFRATNHPGQWIVFSLAFFFSIFRLIELFSINWYLMSYVQIIECMWREFGSFLLMYLIIFLASVGSFVIWLPFFHSPSAAGNSTTNSSQPIKLAQILVASSRTILNHDASEDYFKNSNYVPGFLPVFFLLIFTFVSLVILLNVLIAQLSEVYRTAQKQAKLAALNSRASIIVHIETRYLWFASKFSRLKNMFKDKAKVHQEDEDKVVTTQMLDCKINEIKDLMKELVTRDHFNLYWMIHQCTLAVNLVKLQANLESILAASQLLDSLVKQHEAIIDKLDNLPDRCATLLTKGKQKMTRP